MNGGLIRKTLYETWAATTFFAVGVFAIQILLAIILPDFEEGLEAILEHLQFVQYIIAALLGTDVSAQIGPRAFAAFPWVHPVMLAIMWAHGIMFCTRIPTAEVERGTIDLLLSLPVRRSNVLLSDTAVWILWACVLAGSALIGNVLGWWWTPADDPVTFTMRMGAAANLGCLYLAVGAMARLFASLCDRRGLAIGAAFAVVVASFVLHTLATLNEGFAAFSFLGLMAYYRPLQTLTGGGWAIGDMVVLLLATGVLWSASLMVFARRDLGTT